MASNGVCADVLNLAEADVLKAFVADRFEANHRQYEWRNIVRGTVKIPNPHGTTAPVTEHDAMSVLEA
ncbi:hypothetical protein ACFYV7_39005 [Nocardia suismassiliense]|uniref:Uncharacterized protein n=1 Tax=Nocardia suismassiliense TaxID=2077092 RepID=A0ABW6R5P8_9NOCA